MKKGSKSKNNAVSIGVAFRPVTRAKLDLIAAGLDRPVGWVVRDAVGAYLNGADLDDYRSRSPQLAATLDQAIADAGGDPDEIYGVEQPEDSSNALVSPAIQRVTASNRVAEPSIQPTSPAIQDVDAVEAGDSSQAPIKTLSRPETVSAAAAPTSTPADEPAESGDARPARGLLGR